MAAPRKRRASEVKAHWRDIVEEANAYGEVVVTNHNRPAVVVVSIDRYEKLKVEAEANDPLAALRAEFDRELALLRQRNAASRLHRTFGSTAAQLAKAANAGAIRRKR